jgi:hypothetical protein
MIGSYALDIARKAERDYRFHHGFGYNSAVVSGSQSVWTAGGLYPWLATARQLTVVSTSASDTGTLRIVGLDANYLPLEETITLTGTTPVVTTAAFFRVNYMSFVASNVGVITAKYLTDTIAHIAIGTSQTQAAIYTVPAGVVAYGTQLTVGVGKGGDVRFEARIRLAGGIFQTRTILEIYESTFTQLYSVPVQIPPKSDIDFLAITSGNNFKATASFDLILDTL